MGDINNHAALSPSSMHRRVHCRGSWNLEMLTPDPDTPEAREGTAAHQVLSHLFLTGEMLPLEFETATGVLVDAAMQDGAMQTHYAVQKALLLNTAVSQALKQPAASLHIEERVPITCVHEQCWGTPDVWFYYPGMLDVTDYKYGHDQVDVFENWQLICYALGIAFDVLKLNTVEEQRTRVRLRIVQPRCYHREGPVRVWECKLSDLRAYLNILRQVAVECLSEEARCYAGAWCLNCNGVARCEASQSSSLPIASMSSQSDPLDLTPAQLSNQLYFLQQAAKILKARITGLEEQAINLAAGGAFLPRHSLESTRPNRRWKTPVQSVVQLGELFGINLLKDPEPVSPARAEAMGIDEAVILEYAERPPGARKLVAADVKQLRKIFHG